MYLSREPMICQLLVILSIIYLQKYPMYHVYINIIWSIWLMSKIS